MATGGSARLQLSSDTFNGGAKKPEAVKIVCGEMCKRPACGSEATASEKITKQTWKHVAIISSFQWVICLDMFQNPSPSARG